MDYYTGLENEDCNTVADVENDLVTRIISMDLKEFLIGEDSRDGSDEETAPNPAVRRCSMVNIWLEQAKQEDTLERAVQEEDPLGLEGLSRERAEQEEDPLGLEGLRRIKPDRGMNEEVEASTLSLSQLQLQPSASFQPSSINDMLTNETQKNSFQQHNQGLISSNTQGVASSHNDIDFIPYVHPYSARPRLARSRSPAHPPTKSPAHPPTNSRSPAQPLTNSRSPAHPHTNSKSPAHPSTNSRFGDGCTFKPDNHPSCREERRPRSQENNDRSSFYNTDLSLRDVNPETNYKNWSTNSNSDTVPPYQARINAGSVSGFQTSSSASNFQTSTGSASSFQTTIGFASNFQNTTGSASSFQTNTGSAMSFQTSTGSTSSFQTSTVSASSFQPFSTVRDEDRSRSQSFGGGMRPTLVGQPGGPRWNGRRGANGKRFCNFCKTNGESSDVYLSHSTGAPGAVTCPNLFKHSCEICAATGRNAHTRGYCPHRLSNSTPVVLELKGTQRKSDGSFR